LVCSWIPDLAAYDPLLYRCKDLAHFFESLEEAVQEKAPSLEEERRRQAEQNTWQSRVEVLFRLLDRFSAEHSRG
jgi:hypothetical protein